MRIIRTLKDLKPGEQAQIAGVKAENSAQLRLLEMGLIPGATLSNIRAPFNDPIEVLAGDTELCLRRADAQAFTIIEASPNSTTQDSENDLQVKDKKIKRQKAGDTLLMLGPPNAGKTTLFNKLSGARAKVGNYPGITVEDKRATIALEHNKVTLIDLPGTYSLAARSKDEEVTLRALFSSKVYKRGAIICVLDATQLSRSLYLVTQLQELGLPFFIALTMLDMLPENALSMKALSKALGVSVVDARDKMALKKACQKALERFGNPALSVPGLSSISEKKRDELKDKGKALAQKMSFDIDAIGLKPQALAFWDSHLRFMNDTPLLIDDRRGAAALSPQDFVEVICARHQRARAFAQQAKSQTHFVRQKTSRIDDILLHRVFGLFFLSAIFFVLFQALFIGAAPFMDGLEALTQKCAAFVLRFVPKTMPFVRSILKDGLFAGVGNVIVFVPQIAMLCVFGGGLDDSGYLARAAFLLDKLLRPFGLAGRAFVPLLSGFACAVPAVMAARTIENERDRLITILVTPLVSCSARLPIYTLIIATVFANQAPLFGFINVGALLFMGMYALSIVAALCSAIVLRRVLGLKTKAPPLLLELPPYRKPHIPTLLRQVYTRVKIFLREAGTVILALTIVLWALFTFPQNDALPKQEQVAQSYAGRLGHAIEPVIEPLGYDWKIGVGLIASFAAREVLVSSLGVVYGIGDDADEASVPLRESMRLEKKPDGSARYSALTGLSLMVFFVLAMQCMSTLAAVRRETQSWKWPIVQFLYMSLLAYLAALLVTQVGRLLGFS